ncbi:MAG TPA: hypothetical protein VGN97_09850 [Mesorhizobium sp.]|jgi:hypothetical protein|nr:hypothetical protein [Mesorhizobium sp.]
MMRAPFTLTIAALLALAGPGFAQEKVQPKLLLELNALESQPGGCRLTLLIENRLGAALNLAAFEVAMFGPAGQVERLALLEFSDLPEGKTRVRRFDLPGPDCTHWSRLLVNDAPQCRGQGVERKACLKALGTQNRSNIPFGG